MLAWTPSPDAPASLALTEVPPNPAAPDEAVVAVGAYSVNRGETFLLAVPPEGWRPGKDIAGTVVTGAANGSGPRPGQRVVGHPERDGWAEQVNVPASRLAVLPETVDTTTAAALPLAGLTALRLLRTVGFLGGLRVLLTGASGGVGHYFTELAAHQGADITAVVSEEARGTRLLELGATRLVTDIDQARGQYDVVMDSVGGNDSVELWSKLTTRGHYLWLGQASREPVQFDFLDWRGGASATLTKFSYADSDTPDGDDLAVLVRLVEMGRLHPEIDRTVDWHQTPDVILALLARQIRGNAVLTVTR